MQLSIDPNKGHYSITAYTPGEITINDARFNNSLIIAPTTLIDSWRPQTIANMQLTDLTAIVELQPAIVLLGTGTKQHFPDIKIMAFFYERNIGIEVMTTSAACRTFNVLVSEGRKVVAGLMLE